MNRPIRVKFRGRSVVVFYVYKKRQDRPKRVKGSSSSVDEIREKIDQ